MPATKKPRPHPTLEANLLLLDPLVSKVPEANWQRLACDASTIRCLRAHGDEIPAHARWAFGADASEQLLASLTGKPPAERIKVPDVLALVAEERREEVFQALAAIGAVIEDLQQQGCDTESALGFELARHCHEGAPEDLRGVLTSCEQEIVVLTRALNKAKAEQRRRKQRRASPRPRARSKRRSA